MNPLKDWTTTIPGLVIIAFLLVGSTVAMAKGIIPFDTWWAKVSGLGMAASGGVLLGLNTKKT